MFELTYTQLLRCALWLSCIFLPLFAVSITLSPAGHLLRLRRRLQPNGNVSSGDAVAAAALSRSHTHADSSITIRSCSNDLQTFCSLFLCWQMKSVAQLRLRRRRRRDRDAAYECANGCWSRLRGAINCRQMAICMRRHRPIYFILIARLAQTGHVLSTVRNQMCTLCVAHNTHTHTHDYAQ